MRVKQKARGGKGEEIKGGIGSEGIHEGEE